MADKTPVAGTVVAVAEDRAAIKVGDRWYTRARTAECSLPERGSVIRFNAYGQRQDLFYKYELAEGSSNGSSNGISNPGQPAPTSPTHTDSGLRSTNPHAARPTALIAAAQLMAGSDGTVTELASNTIQVAQAFEAWLTGKLEEAVAK